MRLFIGIELPEDIKSELYYVQKQFNASLAKIKWIAKKNLHLTLKFLGEVEAGDLEQIKNKLMNVKFASFEVKLSKLNVFPDWNNPRVIWVSLLPEKRVVELQQKVDAELLGLFNFDQRFIPHLTLGRIKLIKKKSLLLSELKNAMVNNKGFELDSFRLVKSTLNKDGPIYEILENFYPKNS